MDLQLTGHVALVTGASVGLGRAIAQELAAEGCRLGVLARRGELLEQLAAELPAGADTLIIVEDITAPGAAERIHRQMMDRFGRCDILINNAGGSRPQVDLGSDEAWQEAMLLNFEAGRRIAHAFIPTMREQRHGRIICLTGQDEPREVNAANAPNGAVHIWAKAMSRHLAGEGITINCLPPGRIHSEQVDRRIMASEATQRAAIQDIPVGFVGEPRDLSCLAAFLCSPRARYITGQVIHVDGGTRRFSH
ncbi:SDR family oxidoreductase [Roseomonas terrae]|uniref:SDR family oxidoreductase n=1 Tax=Neoroseomonas terrae TaxID=424799 RepID=A0ABS5EII0_9PROT|nr:SDR family oxidoreductase [Neoroseomonas terrae]MBR0650829.1 SDR family oxidoreductase [Neoroseomonas terrae]